MLISLLSAAVTQESANYWPFTLLIILGFISFALIRRGTKTNQDKNITANETSTDQISRKRLGQWYLLIGIVCVVGVGAFLIDNQNPSDLDQYTGTNDSAKMTLLATCIIVALLGIGARFSYMKYSRINQADLIASAIKSQNTSATTKAHDIQSLPQSRLEQLERLLRLRDAGGISDTEFEEMKKSILAATNE